MRQHGKYAGADGGNTMHQVRVNARSGSKLGVGFTEGI
jgi:hypothetical protein